MRPGGDGGTLAYDEAVPRRITSPNLVFRTFVVDQLVGALLGDAIAPSGLGPGEFGVLSTMRVVQPVMPSELAAELGMPPSSGCRRRRSPRTSGASTSAGGSNEPRTRATAAPTCSA
jgi:hypothetical protein